MKIKLTMMIKYKSKKQIKNWAYILTATGFLLFSSPSLALWVEIQEALKKGDNRAVIQHALPAANIGDVNAQLLLARIYASEEPGIYDYKKSIYWYEKAALLGSATAQYQMGSINEGGAGVKPNYKAAIDWYQKSAEQNYSPAQFRLGLMYYNGENISKNEAKAFELFKMASESGEDRAIFYMAVMLGRGEGDVKDLVEAYKWATIHDWKMSEEMSIKGELERQMREAQIKEGRARAEEWLARQKEKSKN